MLVSNNTFDAGDIVTMKLVNGDEIVAKVLKDDVLNYTIDRPCTVVPSAKGMGLIQALFTADTKRSIVLNKQHVMMAALSVDAMVKHYLQTTTGIEPVTAGSIIS